MKAVRDDWAAAEERTLRDSPLQHHWINPHAGKACDQAGCMWCDGGLTRCDVCNAFEGATTTECPGVRVSSDVWDLVYAAVGRGLDYRQGAWQNVVTRWRENSGFWHAHARDSECPSALRLTGLPSIHEGSPPHHGEFDPATDRNKCAPDCPACGYAIEEARREYNTARTGSSGA